MQQVGGDGALAVPEPWPLNDVVPIGLMCLVASWRDYFRGVIADLKTPLVIRATEPARGAVDLLFDAAG